jgi:molybdenum cofactor cytidylyltransferase
MQIRAALGVEPGQVVSLIGAGGKTTTLYRLGRELRGDGRKVLLTTTTKIFKPTKPHVDRLFLVEDVAALIEQSAGIQPPVIVGAGYRLDEEGKLVGFPGSWIDDLHRSGRFDEIVVEADGAGSRLFKVPSEIEPVIPESSRLVVWVIGVTVIGKPLDATAVHRPERAASLLGIPLGTIVTQEHIIRLVEHPNGCLKGVPDGSSKVALLTHADSADEVEQAKKLAASLLKVGFTRAVTVSYLDENPVRLTLP